MAFEDLSLLSSTTGEDGLGLSTQPGRDPLSGPSDEAPVLSLSPWSLVLGLSAPPF